MDQCCLRQKCSRTNVPWTNVPTLQKLEQHNINNNSMHHINYTIKHNISNFKPHICDCHHSQSFCLCFCVSFLCVIYRPLTKFYCFLAAMTTSRVTLSLSLFLRSSVPFLPSSAQAPAQLGLSWLYFQLIQPPTPTHLGKFFLSSS